LAFSVSLFSPATGEYSPAVEVHGGKPASLELLPFREDILVRAPRSGGKSGSNADE
jgi:hypothetical protein